MVFVEPPTAAESAGEPTCAPVAGGGDRLQNRALPNEPAREIPFAVPATRSTLLNERRISRLRCRLSFGMFKRSLPRKRNHAKAARRHLGASGVAVLAAILLLLGGCATSPEPAPEEAVARAFVLSSLEKLRPGDQVPPASTRRIRLARNEREAVILGVENIGSRELLVEGIEIEGAGPLLELDVYELGYYTVSEPTGPIDLGVAKGYWPDPLTPLGPRWDERTNDAAPLRIEVDEPIRVPPGGHRLFLVDLYLRSERPLSGSVARSTLRVSFRPTGRRGSRGAVGEPGAGVEPAAVSLDVEPYDFTLPREQSFETAVGFSWSSVIATHRSLAEQSGSQAPEDETRLHRDYLRVLGLAKLAPYSAQEVPVAVEKSDDGGLAPDWSSFNEIAGAYLDGELVPGIGPASTVRFPPSASGLETASDHRRFRELAEEHFADQGWLDRAYEYLLDEPLFGEYPEVRARARRTRALSPGVATMTTEPFALALTGEVDIWVPDVVSLGDTLSLFPISFKGGRLQLDWQTNFPPWIYRTRPSSERAWYYTAMGAQYWQFPDLFIDSTITDHRVIPLLAYRYGLVGYLNWGTTASYRGEQSPWEDQLIWFANGDGNLLYPLVPGRHNVSEHRAGPSLRMIALREGIDDYEYLKLVERFVGPAAAYRLVRDLVTTSVRWSRNPKDYEGVRERAAALIENAVRPPDEP
jgi:hypothetical protein